MSKRIIGLDGLRGFAALSVVFCHCVAGSTQTGGYAVNLFFSLSGYLILGTIYKKRIDIERRLSTFAFELKSFWIRRGTRIFPAYYVVTIIALPLMIYTGRLTVQESIPFIFYLQNYLIAVNGEWISYGYTWTLAVEQQFYVAFGILMLAIPSRFHKSTLFAMASLFLFVYIILLTVGVRQFFLNRMPLLGFSLAAAGGYLALAQSSVTPGYIFPRATIPPLVVISAVFSILPAKIFDGSIFAESTQAVFFVVAMPAIVIAPQIYPENFLVRILESGTVRFLGKISYSLYLIHGTILDFMKPAWLKFDNLPFAVSFAMSRLTLFGVVLIASIGLSTLMLVVVEKPCLQRFRSRQDSHLPSYLGAI